MSSPHGVFLSSFSARTFFACTEGPSALCLCALTVDNRVTRYYGLLCTYLHAVSRAKRLTIYPAEIYTVIALLLFMFFQIARCESSPPPSPICHGPSKALQVQSSFYTLVLFQARPNGFPPASDMGSLRVWEREPSGGTAAPDAPGPTPNGTMILSPRLPIAIIDSRLDAAALPLHRRRVQMLGLSPGRPAHRHNDPQACWWLVAGGADDSLCYEIPSLHSKTTSTSASVSRIM